MDGVCNASCQVSNSPPESIVRAVRVSALGPRGSKNAKPPPPCHHHNAPHVVEPSCFFDPVVASTRSNGGDLPGRHSRFKPPGLPKLPARLSARSRES